MSIIISDHDQYDSAAAADDEAANSASSSDESSNSLANTVDSASGIDRSRLAIPDDLEYFSYRTISSSSGNSSVEDDDDSMSPFVSIGYQQPEAGYDFIDSYIDDEYIDEDVSYTVKCGYLVLFSTWIIFVCGIGSIFGVWRWVWVCSIVRAFLTRRILLTLHSTVSRSRWRIVS